MGTRTGKPRGRPKGAKNKRTEKRESAVKAAASAIEAALPLAFQGDSHALLMAIYKDESKDIALRLDAAKAAIGYEKPRLAAVQHSGGMTMTYEDKLDALERELNGSDEHAH